MSSGAGKFYIAHCPKCTSPLKEISPVPLCRCRACNSFLLVKNWKLEDAAASITNASSEKHTSKEKSENSGLISEDGSTSMCSESKLASSVDACNLNIHNGKDEVKCDGGKEETLEQSSSFSSQDKSGKGSGHGEAAAYDMLASIEEEVASFSNKTDSLCVSSDIEDWKENEEDDLAVHSNFLSNKAKREDECDDDKPSSFRAAMAPSKEADTCHLKANFIEMANRVEQVDKCKDWEGGHLANPKIFSPKHASESGSDLTEDALSERIASIENSTHMKDANALGIIWSYRGGELSREAPSCPPNVNIFDLNHVETAVENSQTAKEGSAPPNSKSGTESEKRVPRVTRGSRHVSNGTTSCLVDLVALKMDDEKISGELHEKPFCSNTKEDKSEPARFNKELNKQVENSGSMQEREEPVASSNWCAASEEERQDQCLRSEAETGAHACKVDISPAADSRLSNTPSNRKPVSARTFRCQMAKEQRQSLLWRMCMWSPKQPTNRHNHWSPMV